MADGVKIDLNITHKDYQSHLAVRQTALDLYSGWDTVKAAGETYLYKTDHEAPKNYETRLLRAVYENWPAFVIGVRQSLTWRNPPTRGLTASLEPLIPDVDRMGTHADVFFNRTTERASAGGLYFTLVNKATSEFVAIGNEDIAPIATSADEQAANMRPFFEKIPADDVLDWELDEFGKPNYVVIRQVRMEGGRPGVAPAEVEQRLVWSKRRIEIYEKDPEATGDRKDQFIRQDGWYNALGKVPLVDWYGIWTGNYMGLPVSFDIIPHTLAIYNKWSDRDASEFMGLNPRFVVISGENPGEVIVNSDTGMWLQSLPGTPANAKYAEPTGSMMKSSQESGQELVKRVYELVLYQTRRDSAQVQSAEGQRMDRQLLASKLSTFATSSENSEKECWQFASEWQQVRVVPGQVAEDGGPVFSEPKNTDPGTVAYGRDFDDRMIEAAMQDVLLKMAVNGKLSSETFLTISKDNEVLPADLDVKAELKRIEREQESRLSAAGAGLDDLNLDED